MNCELPKLRPKVTTFFSILQTFFIFFYFFLKMALYFDIHKKNVMKI